MLTKALLFLSGFAVCFSLIACGNCSKKVDCPGYNDTVLNKLFPYANGQAIVFRANTSETVTLVLRNTETTQPYQASSSGVFAPGPVCEARKLFESEERDSAGQKIFTLTLSGNDYQHSADLRLKQTSVSFYAYADTGFAGIAIHNFNAILKRLPTVQIGNRNFTDVTFAARDTSVAKVMGIYQIYYAKNEGLVGYAEYPSLKTWVKQ